MRTTGFLRVYLGRAGMGSSYRGSPDEHCGRLHGVCYRRAGHRALGIREGYLRANDGIVAGGAGAFPAGVPLPADRLAIQTGRPAALDLPGSEDSSSLPPPRF